MTKTLLCDVDGVLANWNSAFRDLLLSLHGPRGDFDEAMKSWDWPKRMGYTNREIDEAWAKVDFAWWMGLRPYPSAEDALRLLQKLKDHNKDFQVYFVTGRHSWAQSATTQWVNVWGIWMPSVICTSHKKALAQIFCKDGPVVAIEDKPALIGDYLYSSLVERVYIVDQPYNRQEGFLLNTGRNWRVNQVGEAVNRLVDEWSLKTPTPQTEAAEAL